MCLGTKIVFVLKEFYVCHGTNLYLSWNKLVSVFVLRQTCLFLCHGTNLSFSLSWNELVFFLCLGTKLSLSWNRLVFVFEANLSLS